MAPSGNFITPTTKYSSMDLSKIDDANQRFYERHSPSQQDELNSPIRIAAREPSPNLTEYPPPFNPNYAPQQQHLAPSNRSPVRISPIPSIAPSIERPAPQLQYYPAPPFEYAPPPQPLAHQFSSDTSFVDSSGRYATNTDQLSQLSGSSYSFQQPQNQALASGSGSDPRHSVYYLPYPMYYQPPAQQTLPRRSNTIKLSKTTKTVQLDRHGCMIVSTPVPMQVAAFNNNSAIINKESTHLKYMVRIII